jgi:hypothetical protein
VRDVEDQNEKLRKVVAGMRHEMERFGSAASADVQERAAAAEEAVRRLSAERQRLIQTCNRLRADLMRCTLGASADAGPLSPHAPTAAADVGGGGHDGGALQEIAQSMQELVRRNAAIRNGVAPRRSGHAARTADDGEGGGADGPHRRPAAAGWAGDGRQEVDTSMEDVREEEAATRGRRRLERVREQLGLTGRATQVRPPAGGALRPSQALRPWRVPSVPAAT